MSEPSGAGSARPNFPAGAKGVSRKEKSSGLAGVILRRKSSWIQSRFAAVVKGCGVWAGSTSGRSASVTAAIIHAASGEAIRNFTRIGFFPPSAKAEA